MKAPKSYAFYGFLIGIIAGALLNLPIMFNLFIALAGLWYANVIQALKTGRITSTLPTIFWYTPRNEISTYFRDKNPISFWLNILIELALASACLVLSWLSRV